MNGNSYKERYFKDYHVEKVPSRNGKRQRTVYVYHGDYCIWTRQGEPLGTKNLRCRKMLYIFLFLTECLFFAAAALQPTPVNSTAGTAITGALSLIPLLYQFIYIIRFSLYKDKIKQIDAEDIHRYIIGASLIHSPLLIAAAMFGCIHAIQSQILSTVILTLLLYCGSAACSLILFFLQRQLLPSIISD